MDIQELPSVGLQEKRYVVTSDTASSGREAMEAYKASGLPGIGDKVIGMQSIQKSPTTHEISVTYREVPEEPIMSDELQLVDATDEPTEEED